MSNANNCCICYCKCSTHATRQTLAGTQSTVWYTCQGPEAEGEGGCSHDTVAELASHGVCQALHGGLPGLGLRHEAPDARQGGLGPCGGGLDADGALIVHRARRHLRNSNFRHLATRRLARGCDSHGPICETELAVTCTTQDPGIQQEEGWQEDATLTVPLVRLCLLSPAQHRLQAFSK